MPYDEARGIVYEFQTGYNCANLSSAELKIVKADGSVDTSLTTSGGTLTLHDEENGTFRWTSSTSSNELADYVGANRCQMILTFSSGEVYISGIGTFTIAEVLVPTPTTSGTVAHADIKISAVDAAAFIDFGALSPAVLSAYEDYYLVVSDGDGTPLKGWIKNPGTGETEGTEIATGTLDAGVLYKITATAANHFGTGLTVSDYFCSNGEETCDASNKVKPVTTPSVNGVTIVSAKYGSTRNWAAKHADFNYKDISSGYTYKIYPKAAPTS